MTKHKSSDQRREQILSAARQCFVERGYASTSMLDISRTSGLSKGGIYFHFESKMHVFLSLIEAEFDQSMEVLGAVAHEPGLLSEKLPALASHFLERFASESQDAKLFIVMSEVALREPEVKALLLQFQSRFIEFLTEAIEHGQRAGDLRTTNARVVAIFLKSLLDGLEGNTVLGVDLDLPNLIPVGVDLLLNGVRRTPSHAPEPGDTAV